MPAGADLSNAVVDRVLFDGANLKDVKFVNAVITGRPIGRYLGLSWAQRWQFYQNLAPCCAALSAL